jgi:hypothetical protein
MLSFIVIPIYSITHMFACIAVQSTYIDVTTPSHSSFFLIMPLPSYINSYALHFFKHLKGLSHEIDFKNVDENGQILALIRAAAGF